MATEIFSTNEWTNKTGKRSSVPIILWFLPKNNLNKTIGLLLTEKSYILFIITNIKVSEKCKNLEAEAKNKFSTLPAIQGISLLNKFLCNDFSDIEKKTTGIFLHI